MSHSERMENLDRLAKFIYYLCTEVEFNVFYYYYGIINTLNIFLNFV